MNSEYYGIFIDRISKYLRLCISKSLVALEKICG
jgi:hypothetical protein